MSDGRTRRLLAILAVLSLTACETSDDGLSAAAVQDSTLSRQQSYDIRVIQSDAGRLEWILEATEATHQEDAGRTELVDLQVTFFDSEGDTTSTLRAREGEVDSKTRHLVAREDVIVVTPENDTLETSVLEWDNQKEMIVTDQPVRITQGRNVYTGIGLESDPGLKEFRILEDFRGTVIDEEGRGPGARDERNP